MSTKRVPSAFWQNRIVLLMLRWVVAAVFLYAGFRKVAAPQDFADSIATFNILPDRLINLVALSLPPFEILLALALVTGVRRRSALVGLIVLLVVFMGALGSALARGIAVDCGCFGSEEPSAAAAWRALLRDVPLLGAVLWLALVEYRRSA